METLNVEFYSNKMILLASKKLESNHYHSNKRRDELNGTTFENEFCGV